MPYVVEGYRLWDKVLYKGQECFVSGRRASGSFALRKLDGTVVTNAYLYDIAEKQWFACDTCQDCGFALLNENYLQTHV